LVKNRYVEAVQDVVSVMAAYCDLWGVCIVHYVRVYCIQCTLCGNFRLRMLPNESTLRHCKNVIWATHRAVKVRYTMYATTWCVFQAVIVTSVKSRVIKLHPLRPKQNASHLLLRQ